jgi:hypothetical protein
VMSTIYSTRLGFSYQDKYACLLFLEELQNGIIRKFYTDYPFGTSQLSLDILIETGEDESTEQRAYEVKTGQKFKQDATTKKSSEIKDVVLSFLEYSKLNPDFKGYISFSKGLELPILNYRNHADTLKTSVILTSPVKVAAEVMRKKLDIEELKTLKSVHKFFKRVEFLEVPYPNEETWTRIDQDIIGIISAIGISLEAQAMSLELPDHYLASKLLFIIQEYSGSGLDITEALLKEIMDFMMLRRMGWLCTEHFIYPSQNPSKGLHT